METREDAEKRYKEPHYLLKCPYCGTELVVSNSELKMVDYVYKDIKCCYCGHMWDELCSGIYEKMCDPDGTLI